MAKNPTAVIRSTTEEGWARWESKQSGTTALVWKTE